MAAHATHLSPPPLAAFSRTRTCHACTLYKYTHTHRLLRYIYTAAVAAAESACAREFETMNYPADAAADPWCCYSNNAGEAAATAAAAVPTSGETSSFFADMVAADYSTYVIYDYIYYTFFMCSECV
jgi:hypothetical protein